ncbi:hypothetical protein D7I41_12735 [Ochrobactrum sp. MH181795]|uniref:Uncharacterized protein n=1 Tax=Brucella lupini TaxID=255457 RepID=A0AB34DV80_9HYPH|nr:hypothetical protein F9L03_15165 [Brucella lupini]KAB2724358.1 hypothetical protein F9K76_17425 [Brucella anthropi]RNL44631.1 hypothetical protein D7I41_12735 [Ochrobactrum sp. MH181795]KAB2736571.1 hypothetical protein F9K74_22915 [Brucella anthropi]KAB2786711.1 hypothetical protein F9K96_20780 [Brucella anthropi]
MPLFNEASRIYNPLEVNFMRSCFSNAAIMLEESDRDYSPSELASSIIMLYESGLRDQLYICELAARLAHQRYQTRHDIQRIPAANNNGSAQAVPTVPTEYNPFA